MRGSLSPAARERWFLEVWLVGFLRNEERGAAPDADGAHGERGGDATPIGDAAGRNHRRGRDGVDHLGDECHGGDAPGVAAGLGALRHDHVCA